MHADAQMLTWAPVTSVRRRGLFGMPTGFLGASRGHRKACLPVISDTPSSTADDLPVLSLVRLALRRGRQLDEIA